MNVVLMHDWLTGFRGGERVLEVFCELFPKAPLYTLIHVPGSTSPLIEDRKITASFLNSIPGIEKHYRKFLPLFPFAVERMKILEKADIVLSSSHCVIKGLRKPQGSKHISYIHSPMRYIYDQFDVYFGPHAPLYQQWGARAFRPSLMRWDIESNRNVDVMVANSHFVSKRIKHYYGLDAQVIHPFVEWDDFKAQTHPKEDYYVMVTAFAPNKRVDLAIQACQQLQRKLVIIGTGQEEERLKAMSGPHVTFLGNVPRDGVIKTLGSARAMIFPGVEDFGITPLEALAARTPVIAFGEGGVLETLNGNVAQFFHEPTVASLAQAITAFEGRNFDPNALTARAQDFTRGIFKNGIQRLVESVYAHARP